MSERSVRLLVVSDLHQRQSLYRDLIQAAVAHRPDCLVLLGDFLHGAEAEPDMLPVSDCARAVRASNVPRIVAIRGNHEGFAFLEFAAALSATGSGLITLHGESIRVGNLVLVGFPCLLGDDTAFSLAKAPLPSRPGAWLPPLMARTGPAARAIWLMHEPPAGTRLSERTGPTAGNPEWTEAIERFAPRLVLFGHDHHTPARAGRWHDSLGDSSVVNAGQSNGETLHYTIVDATFATDDAALPCQLNLQVFPWNQSLTLPARKPAASAAPTSAHPQDPAPSACSRPTGPRSRPIVRRQV